MINNNLIKTKKGAGTLTNWIFVITIVLLFIVILQTAVLNPMNDIYGKDYETGLNTSTLDDLQGLKETSHSEVEGAEVVQSSDGLTLKSSWTIGLGVYETITSFIGGNFISTLLTDILNFPPIFANTLIVLIWLSLILIIIYIFMKVVP